MYVTTNTTSAYYQKAYDSGSGYGEMQYYSSSTCGNNGTEWVKTGCKNDYLSSEIKYVVDTWKTTKAPLATEARLISKDEIENNFEFEEFNCCGGVKLNRIKATWMYESGSYWTFSPVDSTSSRVWFVTSRGTIDSREVCDFSGSISAVRPVIVLPKSAL